MGLIMRLGKDISPCFFTWLRGGVWQAIPKSFLIFLLRVVCEIFRAHEMHSQLEVTEMLECKTYRNTLLHFQVLDRTPAFLQGVHPFCMAGCEEFTHRSKWQREPRTPSLIPRLSPWKVMTKPFVVTVREEPGNEAKVPRSPTVLLLVQYIHHMKPWKWFTVASKLMNKRPNTLELVYFGSRNCKCDITHFMLATNFVSNQFHQQLQPTVYSNKII